MKSIDEMLSLLKSNSNVLGLVEYGSSSHEFVKEEMGDYDLFVMLKDKTDYIESLHFRISAIPVDLNIRSIQEIQKLKYLEGFEIALLEGRIIYDPTKKVAQAIKELGKRHVEFRPNSPSEHSIAFTRHGHRHVLDKINKRI